MPKDVVQAIQCFPGSVSFLFAESHGLSLALHKPGEVAQGSNCHTSEFEAGRSGDQGRPPI